MKEIFRVYSCGLLGMLLLLMLLCACPMAQAQEVDSLGVVVVEQPTQEVTIEQPTKEVKPVVAFRTNLLYDVVVFVPNIGMEIGLPMNFTVGVDWFGNWISSDKRHFYWQGYGGYLTLRYYFGKTAAECPFTGHHVGIYGSGLTFDVEFGGIGYQSANFGFGGGIEYGFSLPIVENHLCMDFTIGVGYQGGEYKKYQPTNDGTGHYEWLSTHRRHFVGPTKAEISLKWLISPVQKKGGKK